MNIGTILSGTFRLFGERLGALATWTGVYLGFSLLTAIIFSFAITGTIGLTTSPDIMAMSGTAVLVMILVYLAMLLLGAVITNAVIRAVLTPADARLAYLRLGRDEFRTIGLGVLYVIGISILWGIGYLLAILATLAVGAAAGSVTATFAVGALLTIALIGFMIWVQVRLLPLFPLSLHRHRISIDAAWALTRGRFWTLFAASLIILIPMIVAVLVLTSFLMGGYFSALIAAGNDVTAVQAAQESFVAEQAAMSLPARLLLMVISSAFFVALTALWVGFSASATRALLDDRGEVSEEDVYRTAELFE